MTRNITYKNNDDDDDDDSSHPLKGSLLYSLKVQESGDCCVANLKSLEFLKA